MCSFLYKICRRFHILQTHIGGTSDVNEDTVGPIDGGLHERTRDSDTRSLFCLALARSMSDTHMGIAGILHDAGNIGKVQIDEARVLDQVRDTCHCLAKHIIRDFKGIGQRNLLVGGIFQTIIRDNQKGINLSEEFPDARIGLNHPAVTFKLEGLGHNTDSQDPGFLGNIRHGRRSARTGAAAHSGGNKDHIRVFQHSGDGIAALFGSSPADLRIRTRALAFRNLFTDLDLLIRIRNRQSLLIGVDRNELDTLGAVFYHAVDNIIAGSADTNNLYRNDILGTSFGLKIHILCLLSESTTQ